MYLAAISASHRHPVGTTRRQQVAAQACQRCRRRKTKVQSSLCSLQMNPLSYAMVHCDEARPTCGPCVVAQSACDYELTAGQTRVQALLVSQQRLREEAHSYASLVHNLRCFDSHASTRILENLRRGKSDAALLRNSHTSRATASIDSVYPWEDSPSEYQQHPEVNSNVLPSIHTLLSVRYSRATCSTVQPALVTIPSTPVHAFTTTYKLLPRINEEMLRKIARMLARNRIRADASTLKLIFITCSDHAVTLNSRTFMNSFVMSLNHTGDPAKSRSQGEENERHLSDPSQKLENRRTRGTAQAARRNGSIQALVYEVSQQCYARFVL